jgi:hypothetical protein
MALNRDQRRALRLLADAPNGATATIMLAHGFTIALLDDLVLRGLATAEKRAMRAGRRPIKVTWLMITDAGRQALGRISPNTVLRSKRLVNFLVGHFTGSQRTAPRCSVALHVLTPSGSPAVRVRCG